jgi:acyl-CoA reductase-like NAD-dependent aldehyde dehydrogenase
MQYTQKDIETIVAEVVKNVISVTSVAPEAPASCSCGEGALDLSAPTVITCGRCGIFDRMEDAVEAAYQAQRTYYSSFMLKDREKIIKAIRDITRKEAKTLARMVFEETGLGRYEDKIAKHMVVIEKTPGPDSISPQAVSGDDGLTLEEYAPFGVIGAITPVTNPTETLICNAISMLAAGNSVVFNVHPQSKKSCAYCVELINTAIMKEGGPEHLVTMVKEPSLETSDVMAKHPKVRLLSCIGGTAMVNAMLRSGKKVVGAGAGNPPVIVDETADLKKAAREIFAGASFDNNILCIAEKSIFALDQIADELIYNLVQEGAFLLSEAQMKKVCDLVLSTKDGVSFVPNKAWIGQDAGKILEAAGIPGRADCRLIICEAEFSHPLVQLEQLMPVLPIVRCKDFDQACSFATESEHGYRHTASIFSRNVYNMTKFAKMVETTIFVNNASTLAGVGYGGEGGGTMGIAGPTGEGATSAVTYTRKRRFVLADGGFRVI